MPFKSEKQRRFLWAEHPDIAKRWAHEYPDSNKKLPMYAHHDKPSDSKEKEPQSEKENHTKVSYKKLAHITADDTQISDLMRLYVNNRVNSVLTISSANTSGASKTADSKQERVDIPHSSKPVYAGEERNQGEITGDIPDGKNISGTNTAGVNKGEQVSNNAINQLLTKLSVVLSPHIEQTMENMQAEREGRVARRISRNRGIKQYPCSTPTVPLPMGMQQNQPQYAQNQQQLRPVGGGSHPQFNPINAFGAISSTGVINGNAAFGAKNSPDSSKIAGVIKRAQSAALANLMDLSTVNPADIAYWDDEFIEEIRTKHAGVSMAEFHTNIIAGIEKWAGKNTPCSCGCGDTVSTCKCSASCTCRKAGGSCYKKSAEKKASTPAWQRSEGKNSEGGLNAKGRASYNKATGGNLKAPVTESNPKGKRAKRQNSFCARMCGMKRVNTGAGTAKDPDSRINKSLRKWNCKCSSATDFGAKFAASVPQQPQIMTPDQTQAYKQRVAGVKPLMAKLLGRPKPFAPATPTPISQPQ